MKKIKQQHKKYGMNIYLLYKNKQAKQYFNVICFNLIDGDLLIYLCGKQKPLVRKFKYITDFFCEYTMY